MSGLFAWAIVRLVTAVFTTESDWISDLLAAAVLGAFIGGLTVAFSDHYSGNRVMPRWIVSGSLIGLFSGVLAGLLQIPIRRSLGPSSPFAARLISWMIAGSFIGLGLGLRWIQVNKARAAHAYIGGLLGGALGGLIFASLGSRIPDLSAAISYILTGIGICFGVTLAPILLRDGILQFVSSGDARAQMKFGKGHKEWELQQGDSYTIGSRSPDMSVTRYRPEIEIFVPDSAIAPCHAILFGKDGRFYLARHPDIGGQPGLAKYVVRVRGKTVVSSQELSNADDILIGRTALRFVTRRSGA